MRPVFSPFSRHLLPGRILPKRMLVRVPVSSLAIGAVPLSDGNFFHWGGLQDHPVAWMITALSWSIGLGILLLVGRWRLRVHREKSRTDLALHQSEERYRSFFEYGTDGIVVLDPKTARLLEFNDQACRQLGYTREEFLDLNLTDIEVLETSPEMAGHVRRIMEIGHDDFETLHRAKGGDIRNVHVTAQYIQIKGTGIFHAIWRDITVRKRAEEALRNSQESLASLFEHAMVGIYRTSMDGRIMMANPAMCNMFGFATVEELSNCRFEDNPTYELARFHEELDTKSRVDGLESHWTKPNGEVVLLRESARIVQDASGQPLYFEGIVEDITERKRAEDEKARLQAQLLQSQKMESLGLLAGGVAHDMNNVLGAILMTASAHRDQLSEGDPQHRAFDMIATAAKRGGEMVKSLLGLARQNPAEERELDLNHIFQEQVRLLERTTLAKVRIALDLDPRLKRIRGDASLLAHAVMNLCVNAVDAMQESGKLTLRTRNLDDGWIEARVMDTGIGMSAEVMAKAMDPFFTTKGAGKGTGLGLSMVYGTVKSHRGRMEIHSEPGRGTEVALCFPAWESAATLAEPLAKPRPGEVSRLLDVLLVDDDELIQRSMGSLSSVSGLRVNAASSGEEALSLLEGGLHPDVVILDMNMPGLGGAGTLPRLRELLPQAPILLVTGRADEATLALAESSPGVSVLPKPFSLGELQQRLEPLRRS
jgi:two-component system, cell cycle sensor histidine kinase and response regulator CckA